MLVVIEAERTLKLPEKQIRRKSLMYMGNQKDNLSSKCQTRI